MLALDVARVEAGLLLIDVDFNSSKKALIESQKYTPFEMGLGRLVQLDEAAVRRPSSARRRSTADGPARQIVGLEISWPAIEKLYDDVGMPPQVGAAASRVAVPVYRHGRQVGRATTTTWSPVLKKLIALATHRRRRTSRRARRSNARSRSKPCATACPRPSSRRRSSTPLEKRPR